ncbi:MAG: signal peptide peptidase SppA [Henriciella sp.]
MLRVIGKIILGLLASLGLVNLLLISSALFIAFRLDDARTQTLSKPENIVLTIDLDEGFVEGSGGRQFEGLSLRSQTTLQDAIIAIRNAADDPRVLGLKANLSQQSLGLAQIQDIRDVIAEFRASGKPTFLYSETIGESVGALSTYYLASAFGEIWVQPSGTVGIAGIGAEMPFIKEMLDNLGIKASFLQRREYKSAGEMFTNSEISPANRQAMEAIVGSWFDQMVSGIAGDRALNTDQVEAMIDRGPMLSSEALNEGLVDHIGYRDEFESALPEDISAATPLTIKRYMALGPSENGGRPEKQIAMIHAIGQISRGGSEANPLVPDQGVLSTPMSKAIRDAANDDDVDALLIRVDSPGGSYVASDTIWREINRAKATSKPIIVSMGNTAASGGYFIAMPADRIFAQPATVTGSIGVILGKIVISEAAEDLGVNFERISFGDSAGMFSSVTDFTEQDLARLNRMLDATYDDFTQKAAAGREMSREDMEEIARGRAWSGADALDAGLVDELGGLGRAIDYTKTQIGLSEDDPVWLVPFPPPEDPFRAILRALEDGTIPFGIFNLVRTMAWVNETLAPVVGDIQAARRGGIQLYASPISAN